MADVEALLQQPYTALAALLGCSTDNIGIVNSATAAWQRIFLGLPLWRPGSCIITSLAEYGSNYLAYLQVQKRHGTAIHVVQELPSGALDLEHLEDLLSNCNPNACSVVSISHIPTSSGRVYDAEAVGAVLRKWPYVIYVLDACQSVGQMPVNVRRIGCAFLTGTGRKYLRGPRGSGFLYVSPSILRGGAGMDLPDGIEPAALDVRGGVWLGPQEYAMHETARRYEEYEMSFAAKVGLGVACSYAVEQGIEATWATIHSLAALLRERLRRLEPAVAVHDVGETLCGIVSFSVAGWSAQDVKAALRDGASHTSSGSASSPVESAGAGPISGQLRGFTVSVSAAPSTRLDFDERGLQEVVRASLHSYNTPGEVEEFCVLLRALISTDIIY